MTTGPHQSPMAHLSFPPSFPAHLSPEAFRTSFPSPLSWPATGSSLDGSSCPCLHAPALYSAAPQAPLDSSHLLPLPPFLLQLERERAEPSHGCRSTPHAEPPSELAPSSTKPLGPLTTSPGTSLSCQTAAPATFIAGTELDIAARASVRGRSSSGHRFHCPTAQIDCT